MNQVFIPEWLVTRREVSPPGMTSRHPSDLEEHDVLTRDVAFNRHSKNDGHHVSPYDNAEVQVGTDRIEAALVQGIDEDSFKRVLSAATRATIGIDISEESLEPHQDWEEMLKGGLQTALESQTVVFAVTGVSRTCTHQLVRSRRAAFHQQSQRASYMGDSPEFRMPESVWRKGGIVRDSWFKAIGTAHAAYRIACEHDISYQDARFILPEGTTNFIMLEYPVREFLNVYAYRACHMFQWEISAVMRECRKVLLEKHPWLEPYVKITCEKTGICEFQGWESVEGQCTLPMAKESNRRFKPVHHRIG